MKNALPSRTMGAPRWARLGATVSTLALFTMLSCGQDAGTEDSAAETPADEDPDSSGLPACLSSRWVDSVHLTTNSHGLHALVGGFEGEGVRYEESLHRFTGSEWRRVELSRPLVESWGLASFENGPLLRHGSGQTCSLEVIDEVQGSYCGAGMSQVDRVFVVHDELAYASSYGALLRYDGELWTEHPASWGEDEFGHYIRAIWANESTVVLTTTHGVFRTEGDAAFEQLPPVPGAPEHPYLSHVWGFGHDDLWVASTDYHRGRLTHFDGQAWTDVWPAPGDLGAGCEHALRIRGLWGAEGELFFHTHSGVYRYRDGAIETFFDADCDPSVRIMSLWGSSPTQVYVALQVLRTEDCVSIEVLRFDGFRWGLLERR